MGGGLGRRRVAIAGASLLVLLAAVGLASRAHTPAGGGGHRALNGDLLLEYALVLIIAAGIVVVPVGIYLFVLGRREDAVAVLPFRRNWMPGLLLSMTCFAIVAVVLLGRRFLPHHGSRPHGAPPNPILNLTGNGHATRAVPFDWMPVIVASSLTLAGLLAAAFVLLRQPRPAPPRRAAEALALALERTLDELRAEPDPRRAVIAAYAQMEGALGRAGLPRRPSEAPREYLERVLPEIGAGAESVERLTGLFEQAKFSPHAIDAGMKEDAIAALELLRDELRAVT